MPAMKRWRNCACCPTSARRPLNRRALPLPPRPRATTSAPTRSWPRRPRCRVTMLPARIRIFVHGSPGRACNEKIPLPLKLAALAAALIQVGCATTPEPVIDVRTVNVAVPVPCREPVPDKPAFPMDDLRPGTSLNQFVSAALAERLVRSGYEILFLMALRACTSP